MWRMLSQWHVEFQGEFLIRMRDYMPPNQRQMLAWVSQGPSLRNVCQQDQRLKTMYNECLEALVHFRTEHLILASRYITSQVKRLVLKRLEDFIQSRLMLEKTRWGIWQSKEQEEHHFQPFSRQLGTISRNLSWSKEVQSSLKFMECHSKTTWSQPSSKLSDWKDSSLL